ncbi:Lsr2 family protein [Microbacterium sp. CFBP9034]|uniref:histone-like nucleoid-structuring protein Lsr2 n=1 Tax=Microbacterium sp. CFBP9034 TaxID=3096540 RepID=UPI002A6AAED9|nr:Lsr2 family protein [Microbacterium sp. CFBP9034]MDY0910906.1 Lsr2 family protein [Microbacterium sp. CFBP9034]
MARRIVHQLVDDLDGTLLEVGEGETVLFSIDGVAYEIDLTDGNAASLRDALAPYVAAGRSVSSRGAGGGGTRNGSSAASRRRRTGQQDYSAIREWAKSNGFTVSERGRVPAAVLEAYEAAH